MITIRWYSPDREPFLKNVLLIEIDGEWNVNDLVEATQESLEITEKPEHKDRVIDVVINLSYASTLSIFSHNLLSTFKTLMTTFFKSIPALSSDDITSTQDIPLSKEIGNIHFISLNPAVLHVIIALVVPQPIYDNHVFAHSKIEDFEREYIEYIQKKK